MWGGRDTVVVPRGVEWRNVEPVPTWPYWNRHISKFNLDTSLIIIITTTTTEEH